VCVDQPRGRGRPPGKTDSGQGSPGKSAAAHQQLAQGTQQEVASQDASLNADISVALSVVGGSSSSGVGSEEAAPGTPPATAPVDEPLTGSNKPWALIAPGTTGTTASTSDATSPSPSLSIPSSLPLTNTAVPVAASGNSSIRSAPPPLSMLRFDDDDDNNAEKTATAQPSTGMGAQIQSQSTTGISLFGPPPIARAPSEGSKDSDKSAALSLEGRSDETNIHLRASPEVPRPASKKLKLHDGCKADATDEGKVADLDGLGLAQPFDVDALVDNSKNINSASTSSAARPNKRPFIP